MPVYRSQRRINESLNMGWKSFCSRSCSKNFHTKQVELICSRPGCNNVFKRVPNQIGKVKACYCTSSCAAKVNNLMKQKKIRYCANQLCKKEFTGYNKYCSLDCIPVRKTKYSRSKVLSQIKSFVIEVGRIPTKRELNKLYRVARNLFGTWNKAVELAGFSPNPVMFAKKYIAKDGHKCDSLAEKIIDDWLSSNKKKHERSVQYPVDQKLKVDFRIGKYWIEFFGLSGQHKRYDQLKRKKIDLAKKFDLKLVRIYPNDLFPKGRLSEKFGFLLK